MGQTTLVAAETLRDFLFERVYNPRSVGEETRRAEETVRFLYDYFKGHEDRLPPEYRRGDDPPERRMADYIAGMTDQYALNMAAELKGQ